MIALAVVVKLARSVSVTLLDCDVKSDIVRATSVTLPSTATPEENSTTPKNIVSMSGTTTANSIAALPRLIATKPGNQFADTKRNLLHQHDPRCITTARRGRPRWRQSGAC